MRTKEDFRQRSAMEDDADPRLAEYFDLALERGAGCCLFLLLLLIALFTLSLSGIKSE